MKATKSIADKKEKKDSQHYAHKLSIKKHVQPPYEIHMNNCRSTGLPILFEITIQVLTPSLSIPLPMSKYRLTVQPFQKFHHLDR